MKPRLKRALETALGSRVVGYFRVPGGDINAAYAVELEDARTVFVKTNGEAKADMFPCESRGLVWLKEAGAVRVPEIIACSDAQADGPRYLVLEQIDSTPGRAADFEERLGQQLAKLHASGAPGFGLDEANYIGTLTQPNDPCDTWVDFYVRRRLEPLVQAAVDDYQAPVEWIDMFKRLFHRMERLAGPPEPPARLHGDLWSGNVLSDEHGHPVLIDPAVYGGHREIDLAMLRLFGGVGARTFAAYREAFPLAPGFQERQRLYQLYPLLVHTRLFGGGYVRAVEEAVRAYL
jgi:fructosamine-3-kinase